ncbi:MAG: polysaccharide biosynthesis C-terminal domain-containing protein [Saprospiraceae bacterium]|nr:polysaccharide biosynthesis C-terminal domain-containing protein [Saprospiraceae bacterium]
MPLFNAYPYLLRQLTLTRALQLFQLLRLGAVLLASILLAKSGLTLADIGAYEALLFVGTVAAFFWANGLLQGMPAVFARLPQAERPAFFFQTFLIFGGIALLVAGLFWLAQDWLAPALTGLERLPNFGWYCLFLFFNLATLPVEYLYLLLDKPGKLTAWALVSFGGYVLALMVPVWIGWGLEGGLAGLAGLGALRFVWALRLLWRHSRVGWRPDLTRQYLGFSLPLVANLLVGNLVLLFDNWLVGWYFHDETVFAVFRYGSREFPLATALATALGTALVAPIAADLGAGLASLKEKTRRLFHLLFPLTMLLVLVSQPLFPVVFSAGFAGSAPLFNIYLLLTMSRVLLPNAVVLALGHPGAILAVGLAELALKVVLGFCFVGWWGLEGIAWSAVLAFWVEKIGLIWFLEKRLGIPTRSWLDLKWYAGYCLALLLVFLLV